MTAIVAKGVTFKYDTQLVLDHLCATVNQNQIYALLGPSGGGKTTLLRLILGRIKLQTGFISVFGHKPGQLNDRISYMPQSNGLCLHFSVKQTFNYFKHIYRLNEQQFLSSYKILQELLDLPPEDSVVSELSGGQQRRISLAVTLISNSSLVILDEPTVGIDLLIVHKIWKYLSDRCNNDLTILFVTHYIEEATNAHRVGLMRNGCLLAEDNPRSLVINFNEHSLESVFLKLCLLNDKNNENKCKNDLKLMNKDFDEEYENLGLCRKDYSHDSKEDMKEKKSLFDRLLYNIWIILVLMRRNLLKYFHMNSAIICILLPATQVIVYCLVYSAKIIEIKAAVFNEEYPPLYSEDILQGLSESPAERHLIKPVLYPSLQSAYDAVVNGSVVGAVWFKSNFSDAMNERVDNPFDPDFRALDISSLHLFVDNTVVMYSHAFVHSLSESLWKLVSNLSTIRGQISFEVPIKVEKTALSKDLVIKDFGFSANLLFFIYLSQMVLSSLVLTQERKDGLFERSLIAGVSHHLVVISHFFTNLLLSIVQTILMYWMAFYVFDEVNNGSALVVMSFLLSQAINAITSGLLISSIFKEEFHCLIILGFFCGPQLFTTGMFWPLESLDVLLRYLSLCSPLAIPVETLRNITLRGWSFSHFKILFGFGINMFSSIVLFVLSLITFRYRQI